MVAQQGHYEQAEQECPDLLTTRTRVLAPTTLDTLTTRYEIGWRSGRAENQRL